ncbi:MAG: hypothetical protein ACXV5I_09055 [Halobacteriota archaeon]
MHSPDVHAVPDEVEGKRVTERVIVPLTIEQALAAYKDLDDHVVEGNVAFPDIDFSEIREDTSDNAGLSAGARFGEEWNALFERLYTKQK